MPTYDYQCRSCGEIFEVIHAMSDDGLTVCERCGGELRRVLYPAGIIFKGSGFYRTDSRTSDVAGGADGGSSPKSSSSSSSTASSSTASSSTSDAKGSSDASSSAGSTGPGSSSGGGESAA